ncbi:MAG: hypothetical protein IID40_02480 [Planctomycetes bacterium]|nr:hypothetical protein [Planctomycetota bacterium]
MLPDRIPTAKAARRRRRPRTGRLRHQAIGLLIAAAVGALLFLTLAAGQYLLIRD